MLLLATSLAAIAEWMQQANRGGKGGEDQDEGEEYREEDASLSESGTDGSDESGTDTDAEAQARIKVYLFPSGHVLMDYFRSIQTCCNS